MAQDLSLVLVALARSAALERCRVVRRTVKAGAINHLQGIQLVGCFRREGMANARVLAAAAVAARAIEHLRQHVLRLGQHQVAARVGAVDSRSCCSCRLARRPASGDATPSSAAVRARC